MVLTGAIVNAVVVVLAGLTGTFFRRGIPERMAETVKQGVGICVLMIGVRGAIAAVTASEAVNAYIEVISVLCMAVGIVIGELLRIDDWMNRFGEFVQSRVRREDGSSSRVGEGFVTATMLFCIGAWAITGAIASAGGDHTSLIAKSVVDGITALILATTLGAGVCLSGLALLIYEGGLTLLACWAGAFLSPAATQSMGTVGSLLILMISLNMLGITRIRVANCIPAMFLPILACLFFT